MMTTMMLTVTIDQGPMERDQTNHDGQDAPAQYGDAAAMAAKSRVMTRQGCNAHDCVQCAQQERWWGYQVLFSIYDFDFGSFLLHFYFWPKPLPLSHE
jgi:hypothetical protein